MVFKIAVAQYMAQTDKGRNISKVIQLMEEASKMNADILLLPECFLTGYNLPKTNREVPSDNDDGIVTICEKLRSIILGWCLHL